MKESDTINLSEQTKFRLSEIIRIENYFCEEINQRKLCSKKLSKYVATFDYMDTILIVLSATSSGVSIILSVSISGEPIGRITRISIIRNKKKSMIKLNAIIREKKIFEDERKCEECQWKTRKYETEEC